MTITPADGAPVRDIQSPQPVETQPVSATSEPVAVPPVATSPESPQPTPEPPKTFGGGVVHVDKDQVQQLVVPRPGEELKGPAPGVIVAVPAPALAPPAPPLPLPEPLAPVQPQEKPLTPEEAARIEALQKQAEEQRGLITEAKPPIPASGIAPGRMVDIAPPVQTAGVAPVEAPPLEVAPETAPPAKAPEAVPAPETPIVPPLSTPEVTKPAVTEPHHEDAYQAILQKIEGTKVTHTEPAIEKEDDVDIGERPPEPQPIRGEEELDDVPLSELGARLEARLKRNEGVGQ